MGTDFLVALLGSAISVRNNFSQVSSTHLNIGFQQVRQPVSYTQRLLRMVGACCDLVRLCDGNFYPYSSGLDHWWH